MNSDRETLALVRDLARLMSRVRPSALKPESGEEENFYEALRTIEDKADALIADDSGAKP